MTSYSGIVKAWPLFGQFTRVDWKILLLRAPSAVLIPEAITDKSELRDKMVEATAGKILNGGRTMSAAGIYLLLGVHQFSGRGSR